MIRDHEVPTFDHPQLALAIEALPSDVVDDLPFGAIRLDVDGFVAFMSKAERRLSGLGDRPSIGLDFFTQLAPCMNVPAYSGRIEVARQSGTLNLDFTHIGDFDDRGRELSIRIQSASTGGFWIFMRRER